MGWRSVCLGRCSVALSLVALQSFSQGCAIQPGEPADLLESQTGSAISDSDSDAGAGPAGRSVTFEVRTKPQGGPFVPKNVGAIWVEDAQGRFVKTLSVWAVSRERWLTRFLAASQRNRVDALTSATLEEHKTHYVSWDLTDVAGVVMPDGEYTIVVEATDTRGPGSILSVPFVKGPQAESHTPPDSEHYESIRLVYE